MQGTSQKSCLMRWFIHWTINLHTFALSKHLDTRVLWWAIGRGYIPTSLSSFNFFTKSTIWTKIQPNRCVQLNQVEIGFDQSRRMRDQIEPWSPSWSNRLNRPSGPDLKTVVSTCKCWRGMNFSRIWTVEWEHCAFRELLSSRENCTLELPHALDQCNNGL